MSGTGINDLVNEHSGEIILGIGQVQIMEVSTDMNGTLFFINENRIGNPSGIHDGLYESSFEFFDLRFDGRGL